MKKYKNKFNNKTKNETLFIKWLAKKKKKKKDNYKNFMEIGRRVKKQVFHMI